MRRRALYLLLPLVLAGCGYNTIQSYDETAAKAKQDIEVQLQRRADLVPNLVNTVKGFATQEQEVFVKVTEARAGLSGAIKGGKMSEMADANQQLTGALSRLMVTVEAYPQLKSDQNFLRLQDELTGYGEPDRGGAQGLQRDGGDVQRLHPQVPPGADRQGDGGEVARLLRGVECGGSRGADGGFREEAVASRRAEARRLSRRPEGHESHEERQQLSRGCGGQLSPPHPL